MIGNAILRDGQLDSESSIGQANDGTLFLRLRDQVFRIEVTEKDQVIDHAMAMEEAEKFMNALPHTFK
jgi:predicted NUDIX family phosphoesterase